jgi:hypothetical protein
MKRMRGRDAGPEDPPLTPMETVLQSAGDLLALLAGKRGLVLTQIFTPYIPGVPEVCVLTLLRNFTHRHLEVPVSIS